MASQDAAWCAPCGVHQPVPQAIGVRVEVVAQPASASVRAAGETATLKPGMLVEVTLARGTRQALVVPEIAVQQIGSETFVWRVKADGTVEKVPVVVGGRVPGKVMLKDGVKAGERIVTEGVGKLQAGAKVTEGAAKAAPAEAAAK